MLKTELLQLCRDNQWQGYSRLRKPQLLRFVQTKERATATLVRAVRRWLQRLRSQTTLMNDTDAFTLEPIDPGAQFCVRQSRFQMYQFDVRQLMRYVLTEGKFQNPFTRQALSDRDLRRLVWRYHQAEEEGEEEEEHLTYELDNVQYLLGPETDLVGLRQSLAVQQQRLREQERVVQLIQEECVDSFDQIVDMIQNCPCLEIEVVGDVLMHCIHHHLNNLFEGMRDLVRVDIVAARMVLSRCLVEIVSVALGLSDIRQDMLLCVFHLMDIRYRQYFRGILTSISLEAARSMPLAITMSQATI